MRFLPAGIIAFLLLLTAGCDKDDNSIYYLQADFNGINESFNTDAYAQEYFGDITAAFSVNGRNAAVKRQLGLSIVHGFNRMVTTGTYDKNTVDSFYLPGIYYTTEDTLIYGSGVKADNPYPVSITISSLTDNIATGTFSGIVYNANNSNDSIIITNGKFYVPLKHQ